MLPVKVDRLPLQPSPFSTIAMVFPQRLERIIVVGTSCSGKTTLAKKLSKMLSIPHFELDQLYWIKGWQPRPVEEFKELVVKALSGESWITDGNYRVIRDSVWTRATTVIWLNYTLPVVLWRCLKRTTGRAVSGAEICSGNHESFRRSFLSRDSIFLWILKTYWRRKRETAKIRADKTYPNLEFIELSSPKQTKLFLESLKRLPE